MYIIKCLPQRREYISLFVSDYEVKTRSVVDEVHKWGNFLLRFFGVGMGHSVGDQIISHVHYNSHDTLHFLDLLLFITYVLLYVQLAYYLMPFV